MHRKPLVKFLLVSLVVILSVGIYLYSRPVPEAIPLKQIPAAPKTQAIALPWPASGQAAIGAADYGVLASSSASSPAVPIASIAKIIAAMAILQQKPLRLGEQGPIITLDSQDLDYFNYYYLNDGSDAKVAAGEEISEYQALQGMLLPSANNLADSLARWAFGSTAAYAAYANGMLKHMGLADANVGSPSGFADDTTATANDLVKIGLRAIANPVIAQIVGQPSATIPTAGEIKSTNWLLGSDGVVGIKTGNTDKAGGCYLFAANRQIQGHAVTIVGAILGAPDLNSAISAARPLLLASDSGFQQITLVRKNQVLAEYRAPWGKTSQVAAVSDLTLLAWKGRDIKFIDSLNPIAAPAAAGTSVGELIVQGSPPAGSNLILVQSLSGPSWHWRIFR
jgi:D-alanyl-D-alanine carboxypeptidase (penicillin-binding protein 5/6)